MAFEIAVVVEEERNREEKGKKERKNLYSTVPLSISVATRRPKRRDFVCLIRGRDFVRLIRGRAFALIPSFLNFF